MKKNTCLKVFAWLVISFVLFITLNSWAGTQSKDFYFPEVRIDVHIEQDGSFTVDEYRTYDFQGSFSWASMWIPLRVDRNKYRYNAQIEDFRVSDELGRRLKADTSLGSEKFSAKWYYTARNIRRTFHIHYRVKGGILSYPDVSELYWQIIGKGWDRPTGYVLINVHFPEGIASQNDILVYGHGPLSGRSEIISLGTVRFTASNLRAGQFVEIRVVWPSGSVNGVPSSGHTRESIQEEEAHFVRETIERAERAREKEMRKRKLILHLLIIWGIWLIIGSLIWLLFYMHFWKKVGKDYRFDDIPDYYRELPSKLSPALVEVLLREGGDITPASFTATLFDLARRGYIEMEDRITEKKALFGTKKEYETTVTCCRDFHGDSGLFPYELKLLDLLFITVGHQRGGKGSKLELEDLETYLKKKPRVFQKWYKEWMKHIRTEAEKLKFIEPLSTKMRNVFFFITIPVGIIIFNPVLLVLAFILVPKIKRRAKNWARENELWRALERFLDDFSRFKDLPPEAYKLWEHYLVFGIIFGNAKKILRMLPIILKDERAVAPVWYYGFNHAVFLSTGRLQSMINSIESMSTSIQQASTSAAHYSSGSGGGFSSGGGGGGGGGGGSAG